MQAGGPGGRGEMMHDGKWPWRDAGQRGGGDDHQKNATRYFWIRAADFLLREPD